MHAAANRYPATATPILTVYHGEMGSSAQVDAHSHSEPILMSSSTATLAVLSRARDWLVPPGYGLWIPGGVEHAASALRAGEVSMIMFAPDRCPIAWTEPTGVPVGRLLRELVAHLGRVGADHPSRPHAEALVFDLLTPLPAHHIQVSMPTDPRVKAVAERLIADPADQRELAAWADHVHTSVRTLSRLFLSETGLSFARWRTRVRVRAAVQMLANGTTVDAVARAVGYRKTSAFIAAFRRATGHTPGTYTHAGTAPDLP
ncbi:AraC-like DNA-binding protein [Allocatelliglobosispora scoriae]|uniref:HTH-type transcriptional regulator RipA n=1 Tax=Allocatelliglobosispora scoriae TaxID=643052 RepID=A0A841BX42_9ACTN|nr:AraC family transcriptional regulator [Allocatelliglobosispora scoriae]MBB5873707.1 AraC-like DNA-binding protein [Allocatelliglobosispora scoriae]